MLFYVRTPLRPPPKELDLKSRFTFEDVPEFVQWSLNYCQNTLVDRFDSDSPKISEIIDAEDLSQDLHLFALELVSYEVSKHYAKHRFDFCLVENIASLKRMPMDSSVPLEFFDIENALIIPPPDLDLSRDLEKIDKFIPREHWGKNEHLAPKFLELMSKHESLESWFKSLRPNFKSLEVKILAHEFFVNHKYYIMELYPKVYDLIENYDKRIDIIPYLRDFLLSHIDFLESLKVFPDKTRLNILSSDFSEYVVDDVQRMLNRVNVEAHLDYLSQSRSMQDFHDRLVFVLNLQRKEDLEKLELKQEIYFSSNTFQDFEIFIPRNDFDLLMMGSCLHNCVASYGEKVRNKESFVVGLKKNNEFTHCIELSLDKRIIQFVSNYNQREKELKNAFEEFLTNRL